MEPVLVEQFFLGCLAHASELVSSEGVAVVIDPQRDVDIYKDAAKRMAANDGWELVWLCKRSWCFVGVGRGASEGQETLRR